MRKFLLAISAAIFGTVAAVPASATTTTWTLENFTFQCVVAQSPCNNPYSLTGQFDFNGTTYSNVSITSSLSGNTYTTADVEITSNPDTTSNNTELHLAVLLPGLGSGVLWVLSLTYVPPGTTLGSTEVSVFGSELECVENGGQCVQPFVAIGGALLDGNLVPSAGPTCGPLGCVSQTPVPAALPLFATGIGGLGLLGWRRKRKAVAV
jgi:hypothetical protein